jgi:hypothetical protein
VRTLLEKERQSSAIDRMEHILAENVSITATVQLINGNSKNRKMEHRRGKSDPLKSSASAASSQNSSRDTS